jgi:hypothetical protein
VRDIKVARRCLPMQGRNIALIARLRRYRYLTVNEAWA